MSKEGTASDTDNNKDFDTVVLEVLSLLAQNRVDLVMERSRLDPAFDEALTVVSEQRAAAMYAQAKQYMLSKL